MTTGDSLRRARSWHFYVSGALGGAVGFVLMEMVRVTFPPPPADGLGKLLALGLQFCAFGLAVGAALGMTEGVVQKRFPRVVYGLVLGVVLGALGGFLGGAVGEAIFSLLPVPKAPPPIHNDVAIVLDASGSMEDQRILWIERRGNDPKGLRKVAARRLAEKLEDADRVTVLDFADTAQVLMPMTALSSQRSRDGVAAAIRSVGVRGGTNLTAGLAASLGELVKSKKANHRQHLIFLTDGAGSFDPRVIEPARQHGIPIYTIGLGSEVDRRLLEEAIAKPTGGRYFPVENADQLWPIFETILVKNIRVDMTTYSEDVSGDDRLRFALRVLSWLVMGLLIGMGQGVRENTREDLSACSLGGAFGGLLGGAIFEPVSGSIQLAKGLVGRGVADVVVGACIGGAMRLAQRHLVEMRTERTTSLLQILPEKSTSLVESKGRVAGLRATDAGGAPSRSLGDQNLGEQPSGFRGLVLQVKHAIEGEGPGSAPPPRVPESPPVSPLPTTGLPRPAPAERRRSLSFYKSRYPGSRSTAIVMAWRSGHYGVEDLAEFFSLPPGRVEQVIRDAFSA